MKTSEMLIGKNSSTAFKRNASGLFYLEDLSVNFGQLQALHGINLIVKPGEYLFVTGASGAGKTSLLNILAGNIQPTTGRLMRSAINVNGKPLFCAEVFQDLRLVSQASGEDNIWVSYDPNLYKSRDQFYQEMIEMAQYLDVKDRLSLSIDKANGGLKQKISLIRALMSKPDVILADEPTSSLDRENSYKVHELFNFFNNRKGTTIIWASHNRELIKQLHGKLIHLEKGKLVYTGNACFI